MFRRIPTCSITVILITATASNGAELSNCRGRGYDEDRVYDYAIEVNGFQDVRDPSPPIKLRFSWRSDGVTWKEADFDKESGTWFGDHSRSFWLREIDLFPVLSGYRFSGPVDCSYLVVDGKCAARYVFHAESWTVALRVEPGEAAPFHVGYSRAAFKPEPVIDMGCVPVDESWRRVTGRPADLQVAARVQANLASDQELSPFSFDVESREGVVVVSGLVGNPAARARVEHVVGRTAGVRSVQNSVHVMRAYHGTALIKIDQLTITIERVRGREVLFFAEIPISWDKLQRGEPWPVSRQELMDASGSKFESHTSEAGNRDRMANLLEGTQKLDGVEQITIERISW